MKNLLLLICLLSISVAVHGQPASKINNSQNNEVAVSDPQRLIGADSLPGGLWRVYTKDSILWEIYNVIGLQNSLDSKLIANDTVSLSNRINGKFSTPSGNSSQYINGAGSLVTFPTITTPVNADWNSMSGLSQILNRPSLSTVATSGSYLDLSNRPTIPNAQVQTDWNAATGLGVLLNKPTLATVATSGSYNDLSNKPTIPVVTPDSVVYYNSSGKINQRVKVWVGTVTPSTSSGYTIDISSAGFTTIISASVVAIRNTNTAYTSPNVSIKSKSTSALVVNIVEDNPATITILGINVLSGYPSVFANVTGLTLDVMVVGY